MDESWRSNIPNIDGVIREKKTHKRTIHETTTTTIGKDGKELKKHEKTVTEETVTVIKRASPGLNMALYEDSRRMTITSDSSEEDSRALTKIKEESRENEEENTISDSMNFNKKQDSLVTSSSKGKMIKIASLNPLKPAQPSEEQKDALERRSVGEMSNQS